MVSACCLQMAWAQTCTVALCVWARRHLENEKTDTWTMLGSMLQPRNRDPLKVFARGVSRDNFAALIQQITVLIAESPIV